MVPDITMGNGNEYVNTGNGTDVIVLGSGNENIQTGNGKDYVSAGNGADLVVGGLGQHTIQLGNGNLIDGSATVVNAGDSLRQILSDWNASSSTSVDTRLSNYPKTLSSLGFYGGYTPFSDSYLWAPPGSTPYRPGLTRILSDQRRIDPSKATLEP